MKSNSTLPVIKDTLKFCVFLLEEQESLYQENRTWVAEARQHKHNLEILRNVIEESEECNMVMGKKQYANCVKVFGKELAGRLFKDVIITEQDTKPTNAEALFKAIKAKGETASRTKEIKPAGFFTESAGKAFEDALFHRNGTNGHKDGKKDWPKLAVSFAELRQAKVQGELSTQFQELANNILMGSEYSPEDKARLMANLVNEYSNLSREGK